MKIRNILAGLAVFVGLAGAAQAQIADGALNVSGGTLVTDTDETYGSTVAKAANAVPSTDATYTATVEKAATAWGWGDHSEAGYATTKAAGEIATNVVGAATNALLDLAGTRAMTGNLNMGRKSITNVSEFGLSGNRVTLHDDGSGGGKIGITRTAGGGTTERYIGYRRIDVGRFGTYTNVGDVVPSQEFAYLSDFTNYLDLAGTRAMTGNLNMGRKSITNVSEFGLSGNRVTLHDDGSGGGKIGITRTAGGGTTERYIGYRRIDVGRFGTYTNVGDVVPSQEFAYLSDFTNYLDLAGTRAMTGNVVTLARDVKSRNAASVGEYGAAFGSGTEAGFAGAAFGNDTTAGEFGAAFGNYTTAGEFGAAFGESTMAGDYGAAFGEGTTAENYGAAFGGGTTAGFAGAAFGDGTAAGDYGFAAGDSTSAGDFGFAAGEGTSAGYAGFAAGRAAKGALGSFVFADSASDVFDRTNSPNSFSVRAAGGTYFDTPLFTVMGEVAAARIALGTNAAVSNWPSASGIDEAAAGEIATNVVGAATNALLDLAGTRAMTGDGVTLARDVKSRDAESVGSSGAAFGSSTRAGAFGAAFGDSATADGYGAAFGYYTTAGEFGAAFGDSTTAGDSGAAFGAGTTAGYAGAAFGDSTTAGDLGAAFGEGTTAGEYGAAFGEGSTAGDWGFSAGRDAHGSTGSFVFADSAPVAFDRTNSPNSFSVRAAGGTYFDTPTFEITGDAIIGGGMTFSGDVDLDDFNLKTVQELHVAQIYNQSGTRLFIAPYLGALYGSWSTESNLTVGGSLTLGGVEYTNLASGDASAWSAYPATTNVNANEKAITNVAYIGGIGGGWIEITDDGTVNSAGFEAWTLDGGTNVWQGSVNYTEALRIAALAEGAGGGNLIATNTPTAGQMLYASDATKTNLYFADAPSGTGGTGWTNLSITGTGNAITGATAAADTLTLQRGTIEGGTDTNALLDIAGTRAMTGDFVTLARDVKSRDAVSVGDYGAAFGSGTRAGFAGAAFGENTTADGHGAAFGDGTTAGAFGAAFGDSTTAGDNGAAFGDGTTAGEFGFSAGRYARGSTGSFVFADSAPVDFDRTNSPNSFSVRAAGGTYFDTPLFTVMGEVAVARIALGTNAAVSNWPSASGIDEAAAGEIATNVASDWSRWAATNDIAWSNSSGYVDMRLRGGVTNGGLAFYEDADTTFQALGLGNDGEFWRLQIGEGVDSAFTGPSIPLWSRSRIHAYYNENTNRTTELFPMWMGGIWGDGIVSSNGTLAVESNLVVGNGQVFLNSSGTSWLQLDGTNIQFRATNGVTGRIQIIYE